MIHKNDKLRDLTPLTTTFVVGESPTAAKLQGMIRQADSAIEYLENKIGDMAGEDGLYNIWATTLARNIGDYSKLTPLVLPNFEITFYEQNLTLGKTEHELDMIPIGELNELIENTMDTSVVISQFKNSVAELGIPGDWTIEGSYIENGKIKRGRKLVTHSPSSGGAIIFKRVTSGRGTSLEGASENTIPSIAQAEHGGPFLTIESIDPVAKTYLVTLPERVKMYDRLGEIIDFSASNSKAGVGHSSQHELPQWFFDANGLDLSSDDEEGNPRSIPLNLIVLYDWNQKKEIEGVISLKASPTPSARKFQFILQTKSDVILDLVDGQYLISVPGNSISEQILGLVNSVYNNTGAGNEMMRLFSHKNLIGLRTTSTDIDNRSAYYGASNIDSNDHSMYLHRNGFTDTDKGAGGNIMRGAVVIGSKNTGTDDNIHENFNVDTDSYSLHFGNITNGPEIKYLKSATYSIDHAAGTLPLGIVDAGLLIKGSVSDLNPGRRNIFLEGDVRTNGNIVLGKSATDTVFIQGKMYVNDELTMIPRATAGVTAEAGKIVYSNVEKALVVNNGSKWLSPWNYSGYTTTIGDGVTSFGKHNGQTAAIFNAAILDVGAGGTIKILPGVYNFLTNKIAIPENIKIEGSGESTLIQSNLIPFEITGNNVEISNIKIKGATVGLNVENRNAIIKDITFENCGKGPSLSAAAVNTKLSNLKYISTKEKVTYTGSEAIATYQPVEVSAVNFGNGSTVWDWTNKEDQLGEYIVQSGNLTVTFDETLDGTIGKGAFRATGTGTLISRKMLPVNPNVGIGGHINIVSLSGAARASVGVECFDKDYGSLGTKYFIIENFLLLTSNIESRFYKNIMSGVKTSGMYFPEGTRFVRPIINISQNTDGVAFDSLELMNLSYARDITPYLTMKFVGEIITAAFEEAPEQFFPCDGRAISRVEYSELFEAIGIAHGAGNGSTTFNIPDYRGVFLRGVDGSRGMDPDKNSRYPMNPGGNAGNRVGSMQGHMLGSHNHPVRGAAGGKNDSDPWQGISGGNSHTYINYFSNAVQWAGGNETRPSNAYVNYFIRYTLHSPIIP